MPAVTSIVLEPVEWDYGGTVWMLRHDNETAAKWIAVSVDVDGMASDGAMVVAVLGDILDPDQVDALAAAVADGSWPAADRYKAFAGWHAYMTGRHDYVNAQMVAAAKLKQLTAVLGQKAAEAAEAAALEETGDEDPQLPLEGS